MSDLPARGRARNGRARTSPTDFASRMRGAESSDVSSSSVVAQVGESEIGSISSGLSEMTVASVAGSAVVAAAPGSSGSSGQTKGIRQTIKDGFNKVGASGEVVKVVTNYLHMNQTPDFQLYQYRVDFSPDEDSTDLKKALMRTQEAVIGAYIFDGHMLYTTKPIPKAKQELTVKKAGEGDFTFIIFIKYIGVVLPDKPMFLQFYNMVMRKCLTLIGLEELGRNFYDRGAAIKIPDAKLELWPGVITAIRNHQHATLMCVEITHKVLRMTSVLESIEVLKGRCKNEDEFADLVKKEMVGQIVMTHYNRRTYKVDDVDFETTPDTEFRLQDGTMTRYADYYLKRYNVNIRNLTQPMLVSYPKEKDKNKGITGNIYLIPSLCNPTGLTDDMRKDFQLMRKLSEHLHMGPANRMNKLTEFVEKIKNCPGVQEEFRKWDIQFVPDYIMAEARKFPQERIFMGPENSDPVLGDANADWTRQLKGRGMLHPEALNNWIIFYTGRETNMVDGLIDTLKMEGRRIQVNVSNPTKVVYDPRGGTRDIRNELQKRQGVRFAFIILPNNGLKFYADVKRLCILDFGIGCQCLLAKNMNKADTKAKQKLGSICTKVMIQITAKVGGVPWGVKIPVKKLMVLGFDVYHCSERKGQSVGALVSTTDQSLNKYYSSVNFHADKSELAQNLTAGVRKSLEAFRQQNDGSLPDRVILFRDGVGEGQINYVLDYEIPRIKEAMKTEYEKAGQEVGKLGVVVVTKKINSRVMLQRRTANKVMHENVSPGTVVDNTFTLPERYDYFLVSQSVNQGTVSPTNYNVIHDETTFTADHMQKLSYKLCHLYYNWCGTVAVPAPCQYAHKLAYLTGIALNAPAPTGLAEKLWYL